MSGESVAKMTRSMSSAAIPALSIALRAASAPMWQLPTDASA